MLTYGRSELLKARYIKSVEITFKLQVVAQIPQLFLWKSTICYCNVCFDDMWEGWGKKIYLKMELFCRNSIEYQEELLLPICKQLISVKSCRHRSRRRRMKTNDYGEQVGQISMTKNMEIYKFLEKISIVGHVDRQVQTSKRWFQVWSVSYQLKWHLVCFHFKLFQ